MINPSFDSDLKNKAKKKSAEVLHIDIDALDTYNLSRMQNGLELISRMNAELYALYQSLIDAINAFYLRQIVEDPPPPRRKRGWLGILSNVVSIVTNIVISFVTKGPVAGLLTAGAALVGGIYGGITGGFEQALSTASGASSIASALMSGNIRSIIGTTGGGAYSAAYQMATTGRIDFNQVVSFAGMGNALISNPVMFAGNQAAGQTAERLGIGEQFNQASQLYGIYNNAQSLNQAFNPPRQNTVSQISAEMQEKATEILVTDELIPGTGIEKTETVTILPDNLEAEIYDLVAKDLLDQNLTPPQYEDPQTKALRAQKAAEEAERVRQLANRPKASNDLEKADIRLKASIAAQQQEAKLQGIYSQIADSGNMLDNILFDRTTTIENAANGVFGLEAVSRDQAIASEYFRVGGKDQNISLTEARAFISRQHELRQIGFNTNVEVSRQTFNAIANQPAIEWSIDETAVKKAGQRAYKNEYARIDAANDAKQAKWDAAVDSAVAAAQNAVMSKYTFEQTTVIPPEYRQVINEVQVSIPIETPQTNDTFSDTQKTQQRELGALAAGNALFDSFGKSNVPVQARGVNFNVTQGLTNFITDMNIGATSIESLTNLNILYLAQIKVYVDTLFESSYFTGDIDIVNGLIDDNNNQLAMNVEQNNISITSDQYNKNVDNMNEQIADYCYTNSIIAINLAIENGNNRISEILTNLTFSIRYVEINIDRINAL